MQIAFVPDLEARTFEIPRADASLGPMPFISALRLRASTAAAISNRGFDGQAGFALQTLRRLFGREIGGPGLAELRRPNRSARMRFASNSQRLKRTVLKRHGAAEHPSV